MMFNRCRIFAQWLGRSAGGGADRLFGRGQAREEGAHNDFGHQIRAARHCAAALLGRRHSAARRACCAEVVASSFSVEQSWRRAAQEEECVMDRAREPVSCSWRLR